MRWFANHVSDWKEYEDNITNVGPDYFFVLWKIYVHFTNHCMLFCLYFTQHPNFFGEMSTRWAFHEKGRCSQACIFRLTLVELFNGISKIKCVVHLCTHTFLLASLPSVGPCQSACPPGARYWGPRQDVQTVKGVRPRLCGCDAPTHCG